VKIILFLIFTSLFAFASGDHHEEEGGELPAGVVSFHDEEAEFELRENVLKNFNIASMPVMITNSTLKVPDHALVRSLDKTTIFFRKGNVFQSIPVKIVSTDQNSSLVQTLKNPEGTEIVHQGANFLQTILLSLEEGPSEGHGH
jgi:hypothetical protein